MLQQELVEFAIDFHISSIVVLLIEFEKESLDKHLVGEVEFVGHDDGNSSCRFYLGFHFVVEDVGFEDEEGVCFLVLFNDAVDDG